MREGERYGVASPGSEKIYDLVIESLFLQAPDLYHLHSTCSRLGVRVLLTITLFKWLKFPSFEIGAEVATTLQTAELRLRTLICQPSPRTLFLDRNANSIPGYVRVNTVGLGDQRRK